MYEREWTVLRLSKQCIEFHYFIKPQLEAIKQRDKLDDHKLARLMGYKNRDVYRNSMNVFKIKEFIQGYNAGYEVRASLTA